MSAGAVAGRLAGSRPRHALRDGRSADRHGLARLSAPPSSRRELSHRLRRPLHPLSRPRRLLRSDRLPADARRRSAWRPGRPAWRSCSTRDRLSLASRGRCSARRRSRSPPDRQPARRSGHLTLAIAGFYGWLALAGVGLDEAGRRGLLLGPFSPTRVRLGAFHPGLVTRPTTARCSPSPRRSPPWSGWRCRRDAERLGHRVRTGQRSTEPRPARRGRRQSGRRVPAAALRGTTSSAGPCWPADHRPNARWIGVSVGLAYGAALVAGPRSCPCCRPGSSRRSWPTWGSTCSTNGSGSNAGACRPGLPIVLLILAVAASIGFLRRWRRGLLRGVDRLHLRLFRVLT